MIPGPRHPNEARRLEALAELGLIGSPAEERYDRLARLASAILDTPIALVSLVDDTQQYFKARVGIDIESTARDVAFCTHAIADDTPGPFVVNDAASDPRFADNPFVTGDPGVRFYAGQVIHAPGGMPVGTLCVVDHEPREPDEVQLRTLVELAALVEDEIERSAHLSELSEIATRARSTTTILDTITEGVFLQDLDGTVVECNAAAQQLLGVSADQLNGHQARNERFRPVHADGTPMLAHEQPSATVLRTGQPVPNTRFGVHRPDGEMMWLRACAQPVIDESGTMTGVVASFDDITARVDLENALRRNEQIATSSLDALEQGVVLAGTSGVVHRMNPAAEKILGFSAAELTDRWTRGEWNSFDEHGEPLALEQRPTYRALNSGVAVRDEIVGWDHKNGERIILRISCIPDADGEGGLVVAFADITDELRTRRLLHTMFETAPAGIALLDDSGAILRANPSFELLTGRTSEELARTTAKELIVETGGQMPASSPSALVSDRREYLVQRPDDSRIWVSAQTASFDDVDQSLTVVAAFDTSTERQMITDLTRYEHLFRHSNDIIFVIAPNGELKYSSPSRRRILGHSSADSHEILDYVHPDDLARAEEALQGFLHGSGPSEPFVIRVRAADDTWRSLECVGVNLVDEPSVGGVVITARDATDRVELALQLERLALHDELTGLASRRPLYDRLDQSLQHNDASVNSIGVCFIDLDGFKGVNDSLGHAAGDQLLVDVAETIRTSIRHHDLAARLGGDEFVVVLESARDIEEALTIARRIRSRIEAIDVPLPDGLRFGASVGVALSVPGDDASSLISRADRALYDAKADTAVGVSVAAVSER